MKKISILMLFLLVSSIIKPVQAQTLEQNTGDYVEITEGTPAPFSGLLFSYDGMTNALVRVQQKNQLIILQKNEEREKLKIKLDADLQLSNAKLSALQTMHDSQMKIKDEAISSLKRDLEFSKIKGYGGIILGLAGGILLMRVIYSNK